ncbi:MAG: lysophospholipid acyltransferase family protein [Acidimicrobiia bacterium]
MKDLLAYLPFRFGAAMFGLLPIGAVRWLGRFAGTMANARTSSNRPLLASHMRRVLGSDASAPTVDAAVKGMYLSYGRYWAETFWFRPKRKTQILDEVTRVNFGPVHKAQEAGQGIVFALPHVGNWEIAGVVAGDMGLRLMAVAEDLSNKHITEWFLDVREKFGIEVVLTTDPARRSKMVRHLKSGGSLALLSDRDVTGRGVKAPFFGEETSLPSGPVALAEITKSVLIPVVVYFNDGGYTIEIAEPITLPEEGTRQERLDAGAVLVARAMERFIRKHPEQWHLFQPNWPSDSALTDVESE